MTGRTYGRKGPSVQYAKFSLRAGGPSERRTLGAKAGMTRVYGTRRLPGDGRSALGKERARQHLFHRKGTSPREYLVGQSGLCDRSCTSDRMGVSEHRRHIWSQTGRLAEDSFDLKSLLVDCRRPTE